MTGNNFTTITEQLFNTHSSRCTEYLMYYNKQQRNFILKSVCKYDDIEVSQSTIKSTSLRRKHQHMQSHWWVQSVVV